MTIEERYAHWQEVIEAQKTSGLSIADYCRNRDIRTNIFYAWRRRISKQQMNQQGFIELRPSASPTASAKATGIRIVTAPGYYIEVNRGFDPSLLRAVLACVVSR